MKERRRTNCPALFMAALLGSCAAPQRAERVVLITMDTTRADHLRCFGSQDAETPALDRLAAEGVVFERAQCTVPVTLPSHASIFTGLYPAQHGVRYNGVYRLGDDSHTLAERLKEQGFATGAVPAAFPLARRYGLAQGFDTYEDLFDAPGAERLPKDAERKADDVARRGIAWLEAHPAGKAFLWLHFYDPHFPYAPPFPFNQEFRDRPYDGEIAAMDREIGRVLERLRRDSDGWKSTLVVVVADHGEGLYDHREALHGSLVYRSTIHVPLIIKAPGGDAGIRSDSLTSTVDLLPTILDYVGASVAPTLPGRSLRPALEGRSLDARPAFFESWTGAINFGWARLEGVQRGKWKLISGAVQELYDVEADPGETNDLAATDKTRVDQLAEELSETMGAWEATTAPDKNRIELDTESLERLASLGYVGAAPSSAPKSGADPKTLIYLETELLHAQELTIEERWAEVVELGGSLLERDPNNRLALGFMARATIALNRPHEAVSYAERLAKRYTDFEEGHDLLGLAFRLDGQTHASVEAYRAGTQLVPEGKLLHFRLALALFDDRRPAEACVRVRDRLGTWPDDGNFQLLQARCEALEGNTHAALATLERVIRVGVDPRSVVESEREFAAIRQSSDWKRLAAVIPEKPD